MLVLIAVLAQFGVQTTSIIALLGAAGLAIGLALQGTLQNISAGIMLLFLRPFRVDDYIDAGGLSGTVDEIGLFTTHMRTYDGIYLEVPKAKIWNRAILNYSRVAARRMDVVVGISYGDNIDTAQAVLLELMNLDSRVNAEPAPEVAVVELSDSAVNLNRDELVFRAETPRPPVRSVLRDQIIEHIPRDMLQNVMKYCI